MNAGKFNDAIDEFNEVDRQHSLFGRSAQGACMSPCQLPAWRLRQFHRHLPALLTLYPGSSEAAYAQYILGQSYFAQIKDVTRDQEMTEKALTAMQTIVGAILIGVRADAGGKVIQTRDQLAGRRCRSAAIISSSASTSLRSTASTWS
jgi:outer membrane protein assembly factor BamD